MNRIVLVAATLLAAVVVPARAQQWQNESLRGEFSAICDKKLAVVKNEAQWEDLWKQHAGEKAQPPKVDFSREMVVAVFLGVKNKAGYQIDIVTMPDPMDKNKLVIFYKEIPPHGDFAAQVVSHPYAMIKVKVHRTVTFEVNQDAGVLPGEQHQSAPRRISPDQAVHMYDTVGGLAVFDGSFDGFNRP